MCVLDIILILIALELICRPTVRIKESLVKNRQLCFNPRYGGVGLLGYPFFIFCELLSPAIELAGYFIVATAIIARQLHSFWRCRGLVDFFTKRASTWGQPARKAF
jgi:hypothetical protein